jgi:hypothetical protein
MIYQVGVQAGLGRDAADTDVCEPHAFHPHLGMLMKIPMVLIEVATSWREEG